MASLFTTSGCHLQKLLYFLQDHVSTLGQIPMREGAEAGQPDGGNAVIVGRSAGDCIVWESLS